jgi:hypothetical protein
MSHAHESKPQHGIPTVMWRGPASQNRPGTLRPLPLPIHPEVPAIPGGLPGLLGTRSGLPYTEVIPGRSSVVRVARNNVAVRKPIAHVTLGEPLDTLIPGRSGGGVFFPHANLPAKPHPSPTHVPHVGHPVLR